ncbi:hypothetical protein TNCV_3037021 [Trichonephila clavipes]|nr:hypothetical protein TNCV_3037021 [Trichonephila clavipes]
MLLATDLIISTCDQVKRMTPELVLPLLTCTPHQRESIGAFTDLTCRGQIYMMSKSKHHYVSIYRPEAKRQLAKDLGALNNCQVTLTD